MADILQQRDGAVGTIVFSNVDKYNAMTAQMWRDFPTAIAELDADPSIHAIVLVGAGDKAFVSGADVSQFGSDRTDPAAQRSYNEAVEAAYVAPVQVSKPVIAQIRGICVGGGLGLAAACDIRICADDARFRMPAGRLGLGYSQTGVHRFVALVGVQNTYDMFFSARTFDAAEALRMGFVGRVVPAAELHETVRTLASLIAENAPLTAAAVKRTVNAYLRDPPRSSARRPGGDRPVQHERGLSRRRPRVRRKAQAGLCLALNQGAFMSVRTNISLPSAAGRRRLDRRRLLLPRRKWRPGSRPCTRRRRRRRNSPSTPRITTPRGWRTVRGIREEIPGREVQLRAHHGAGRVPAPAAGPEGESWRWPRCSAAPTSATIRS